MHWRYVLLVSVVTGGIAGIAGGLMISILRPPFDSLRVKRIELVDSRGFVYGTWGTEGEGRPVLTFLGNDRKPRLRLSSHEGSVAMQMFGLDERPRVTLGTADGRAALNMGDDTSLSRLLLGFQPNDVPSKDDDTWGLTFKKSAFSSWAGIGVTRDPKSGLTQAGLSITDKNGKVWSLPPP